MEGGWFDEEAIAEERLNADMEQARFEEEGNRLHRKSQQSKALRAQGRLEEAARMCPHGGGYPLASPAAKAENDPGYGQDGFRCMDCGSRLSDEPWGQFEILVPCEIGGRG